MTRYVEPDRDLELQGRYAGMVSRFLAYLIDVVISAVLLAVLTALSLGALSVVTGRNVQLADHRLIAAGLAFFWYLLYITIPTAASGRTPGMGVLGLVLLRSDGRELDLFHAFVRALLFPVSFVLFGLGFVMGLLGRTRQCLHDRAADTVIVYSWDARAARLRLRARR